MIISPPFLPSEGLNATDDMQTDPMMAAVERFELAHGIYPVAFDRRWHCGIHLASAMQNDAVRAIADGEVVAFRVCQHACDGGGGKPDSNAGFVLLRHTTETGDGRTLTFYSLYMHLLDLASYQSIGADAKLLPEFLRLSPAGDEAAVPSAQSGEGHKVRRKDVLGWTGACHGQRHLHFEIFMTQQDFDAYFGHTQLGHTSSTMAAGTDCWGHSYYMIPAGKTFRALPPGTDAHNTLHGIEFEPKQAGQNELPLYVEMYFNKGSKYTNVWSVANDGRRTLLTALPSHEKDYEYDLYKRATALYPACPSDGYEMLRFGRILSSPATLTSASPSTPASFDAGVPGNPHPVNQPNQCATWMRVAFAEGQEGYIDISNAAILKLSDADFPLFMGWQKISEGNSPFNEDRLCDIGALKKILKDTADHQTPQDTALTEEYQKEDVLARYVKSNDSVRSQLRGFVCEAPGEWDSTHNEERYRKLKDEGEFYHGNEAGYTKFINLLKSFQFWDKTGLPAGQKLWFFHPLMFIRHFRKCGWLSHAELASTFPQHLFYTTAGNLKVAITENSNLYTLALSEASSRIANHVVPLNECIRKYIGCQKQRAAIFLSQVLLESAQWRNPGGTKRLLNEWGCGAYSAANPATQYYAAFYGRGIMQLTWAGNYDLYGKFKSFPTHIGPYVERLSNSEARITATSQHYNFNPNDHGHLMQWSPRFDPDIVAENRSLACDSGGFYWISKLFSEGSSINRVADRQYSVTNTGFVNRLVNGGGNGYDERQAYTVYMLDKLADDVSNIYGQLISIPGHVSIRPDMTNPK